MPKMIWKGITDSDFEFKTEDLPVNSQIIHIPGNSMTRSVLFAIPFILLCFFALWEKLKNFSLDKPYLLIGIVLSILLCTVHELLHAIVYPKKCNAYIGIIPKKFIFYMSCAAPLKKMRFILMSLLPMILGIIPLIVFACTPSDYRILDAILWPMAMMGLVSPCPDYMNVYYVLKEVPKNAYIQDGEDGLYWFIK
ncbi:MAG: DUF3267 domain-containing protein [Prevotella sp.]|jgi:hypothetical protein|nr:DUF3267 domain-containing protein [Prevotella sp.]MCI2088618.1 DUF3267 domain-containing protein [Prevotella sp.]MCI2124290.1 DUF3267 domain-containing protein [Prevotella sp.]